MNSLSYPMCSLPQANLIADITKIDKKVTKNNPSILKLILAITLISNNIIVLLKLIPEFWMSTSLKTNLMEKET